MSVNMTSNEKRPLLSPVSEEGSGEYQQCQERRAVSKRLLSRVLLSVLCFTLVSVHLATNYLKPQHKVYPGSTLKWEPCGELNKHSIECTRIDVPMDQFNKSASEKTFSIPLIRMVATNASATGGKSILLNPGGPGGSGANFLWRRGENLNKIIGEGFHLLSFDPRGVNGSIPRAICFDNPADRSRLLYDQPWDVEFQAGEMFTGAENHAKACADVMGEHGAYINTPQTAADMNSILDAIGQEKMYYWGFSYGTTLGQTYAQLFPERVSRLIIDGVSNLDDWYNTFFDQEDLIDTDAVYSGFFKQCFEAKDNCPLNSITDAPFESAANLESYVNDFLENLQDNPIAVYLNQSNYGAVTKRSMSTNAIFPALYKPVPMWPTLAENLASMLKGDPVPCFEEYSDSWFADIVQDDSNTFVVQNDNWKTGPAAPFHGIKPLQNLSLSTPGVSKIASGYMASDLYGRASWGIPTSHNFHPEYYPEYPKFKTNEPILVLSTTYDPVCPLISAQKAHQSFEGAGFVEQKSYGHCTVSMPSICTAKHVRRYFSDGILPEEGATCEIDDVYFPSPESAMSVQSGINSEDAELLEALKELASIGIDDGIVFRRGA